MNAAIRFTLLVLCAAAPSLAAAQQPRPSGQLAAFADADELLAYLAELNAQRCGKPPEPNRCAQRRSAVALEALTVTAAPALAAQDAASPSVTNVQHAGVDEGGIVKLRGDHLIVLRRGRLFTVDVGGGRLTPVSAVDAFGPGIDARGTWYDELLVTGSHVLVIGYSYARGGTEVGVFEIDDHGRLRHRSTYQLRSNDYYSSRNYTSRVVDGRLVFYTPLALRLDITRHADLRDALPALRRWTTDGRREEFRQIASVTRIYRPAREFDATGGAALHTVTSCAIERGELSCEATAVLGPFSHAFYVSPAAVYVWTGGGAARSEQMHAAALVYRLPLGGGAPAALGVAGSPIDQFSFLESDDAHLNVVVATHGHGQWMWRPERAGGSLALLRVPLAAFGDGALDAEPWRYRPLPDLPTGHVSIHNRFVGDHLLVGTGAGWRRPGDAEPSPLSITNWRRGGTATVPLGHPVDRLEPLGSGALVVGADQNDLHFSTLELTREPRVAGTFVLPAAAQGETRSHGFFYRPDAPDTGVLGLPVRGGGRPGYEQLTTGSAAVVFLRNRAFRLEPLGSLAARATEGAGDGCVASCVDWYGNARPLFVRGRVFALLGYELVEGRLGDERIREIRRVNFAPLLARASRP